jgi:acetoin utilization protein AcuB
MKQPITKESMTKSMITVKWSYPMDLAYQTMEERRIRHLPVTDETGKVMGVLSLHDVERAMNPNRPGFAQGTVVGDFMSWPALTVKDSVPIRDVAEGMVDEKVSCFLVENEEGALVGIITSEDLLRLLKGLLSSNASTVKQFAFTPFVYEAMREMEAAGI